MTSLSGIITDNSLNKSLSGIQTVTDGNGSTMSNGIVNCKSLYVNGSSITSGTIGLAGPTGPSGTITIAGTNTLTAGSTAYCTNSGSSTASILTFGVPIGNTGAQGVQGIQGLTGGTGSASTVTVGTTSTLGAGNNAYVTNTGTTTNAVLNFSIPTGYTGSTGFTGASGSNGSNGIDGISPNLSIGTVTGVAYGNPPSVTMTGTSSNPVLNFNIVTGATGANGSNGSNGHNGSNGSDGATGATGASGASVDVMGIIAVALAGADSVATVVAVGVIETEIAALEVQIAVIDATLIATTTNVSTINTTLTTLETEVTTLNTDVDTINIDITALDAKTSNMISTAGVVTLIDCPTIKIGDVDNLLVQIGPANLSTFGSVVNIGPTSQFGSVVINGFVTFPLMQEYFGFTTNSGYMSQFG